MTFQSSKIIMEKGDLIKNETISLIQNLFWQLSKLWYRKILWIQITDVNSKEKCKVFKYSKSRINDVNSLLK